MLSFQDLQLDLRRLNVLIGPNGSGKSNLIDVIDLVRSSPDDALAPLSRGGRSADWFWQGSEMVPDSRSRRMSVEALVRTPQHDQPLRYVLSIADALSHALIAEERLEMSEPLPGDQDPYIFFAVRNGRGHLNVRNEGANIRRLQLEDLSDTKSVFSERKDPLQYPEITFLGKQLERVRIYRDWNMGRYSFIRSRQPADKRGDFLDEDAGNLALVLNRMEIEGAMEQVEAYMRRFYEGFGGLSIQVNSGEVQLYMKEKEFKKAIPATRLSDGTLRFLSLLAVLCHPSPPPLICIEEPELNLHPDVIPLVGQLLKDASERTQVIVTTHSDILVDSLSDAVESVIVCEKSFNSETKMHRLNGQELDTWLEDYRLGQLWRKGELGGTRW